MQKKESEISPLGGNLEELNPSNNVHTFSAFDLSTNLADLKN